LPGRPSSRQRVAEDDVADVLPLDEHVGLADGVGLGVQLLAVHRQPGLGVQLGQVLAGHAQHAAGAGGRVVEGAHHAGLGQRVVVLDEQQVDHQADDLARGEVLPGGLVGELGELADQLLEHRAHLALLTASGCRSMLANFSVTRYSRPALASVDLGVELEALEDVAHGRRERLDVGAGSRDVVLVAHELLQVQRRGVVEVLPGLCAAGRARGSARPWSRLATRPARRLGGFEHAVEAAQHREGQDDLAVLGLLVVAAQQVGDGPDEGLLFSSAVLTSLLHITILPISQKIPAYLKLT
jgi:hypothetical protein